MTADIRAFIRPHRTTIIISIISGVLLHAVISSATKIMDPICQTMLQTWNRIWQRSDAPISREQLQSEIQKRNEILGKKSEEIAKITVPHPSQFVPPPSVIWRLDPENNDIVLEAGYSKFEATVDNYAVGAARPNDAPTARLVLDSLLAELASDLFKRRGLFNISVEIHGFADGVPVKSGAIYRGEFGNFGACYSTSNSPKIFWENFTAGETRLTNNRIALLRCTGIHHELKASPQLTAAPTRYIVSTTDAIGGQFRRVLICIRVSNFFQKEPLR